MRGFISQKEYEKKMQDVAEPFLKQRREDFWLERETGRKIHCVYYRADNARGIVIISHGFTETAEKYKENIYYFLQQNYSVYIPEHCGHGRSYGLLKKNSPVYVDFWERLCLRFALCGFLGEKKRTGFASLSLWSFYGRWNRGRSGREKAGTLSEGHTVIPHDSSSDAWRSMESCSMYCVHNVLSGEGKELYAGAA